MNRLKILLLQEALLVNNLTQEIHLTRSITTRIVTAEFSHLTLTRSTRMPYLRKTGLLAITCLSLTIFGAMTARADTVVFTNRAAFTAASTGLTTINFEGIAAANSVANFASPLTLQGTTFAGSPTGAISVVDSGFFSPLFQFNSGAVLSGFGFIDVTLPAGATAIGADIMSTNPDGQSFQVLLSTGAVFTVSTPARPNRGFFGITFDSTITSIHFTTTGIPLMDNFTFGQAQSAPVPEPVSMVLLATGLTGIVVKVRKGRKSV